MNDAPIKGDILIVDDTPLNLRLLSSMLISHGYQVRSATSGAMALTAVEIAPPDLILLDIAMPEMNGYEVCQRLKANETTQGIPVIFISALGDVPNKVKAFGVGGADYITKPFQIAEVIARVDHQLMLLRLQQKLQQQNARLQAEIQERHDLEERYRSFFENAVEGIFQVTIAGTYLSGNPALAKILGYDSPYELMQSVTNIGKQLYVQPQRRAELLAYMQRYDEVSEFESEVYRKDGTVIWISENVRAVKDVSTGKLLYYEGTLHDITDRRKAEEELRRERKKTERLLLNILPQPVAERLKRSQQTIAEQFSDVTILFADLVDFTSLASRMPPKELVTLLNQIFSAFDHLAERYKLEKIKTIGDAYMAAGGFPSPRADHAQAIAELALGMQQEIQRFKRDDGTPFQLRIGINTGPVVAGVIGIKKFSYDLWGDTVNVANRMESMGMPGVIQVTESTYEQLKHNYHLEKRGSIAVKGKGEMVTYWLVGRL